MAAARALGVKRADAASADCGDGVLHKARFVQRVRMDGYLHVVLVGHIEAVADGRGRGAPVFVQLEPDGASVDLLAQRPGTGVALPRKPRFMGKASAACSMRSRCQGPGVQVVASVPVAGPCRRPAWW